MFSSERNITLLRQLFADLRHYGELRLRMLQLDFVSKMAVLLSALIVGAVLFVLLTIVILFLSFTAAVALSEVLGGMVAACAVIAGGYVLLALLVYFNRRRWVIEPVAAFLRNLFLDTTKKGGAK